MMNSLLGLGYLVLGMLATEVAPQTHKGGPSIILASHASARLDSDRLKGGGTDDTRALQSILDRAKDGRPVHLKVDGTALIRGLDVYGNTTIECTPKGGFYLKDGAERAMLRNAHRSRTEILDHHITIRGCFLNGNREGQQQLGGVYNKPSMVSTKAVLEPDGTYKSGLQFFGVHHLKVEDVVLWNTRSFGAWIANAKFVQIKRVTVDSRLPDYPENGSVIQQRRYLDRYRSHDDGLHFNGRVQHLVIDGVILRTEDDGIGLNANDGGVDDMTLHNTFGPYVGQGPITDVTVRNVHFEDALQGIRLLSSNQRIDRITIDGLTGRVRFRMAILSHFLNPSKGRFGSISFSRVAVDPARSHSGMDLFPGWKRRMSNSPGGFGEEGDNALFSLNSPVDQLRLHDIAISAIDDRPIIRVGADAKIGVLDADIRISDPRTQSIPLKISGEIEHLNFTLDWKANGADVEKLPIAYHGGMIKQLSWVNTPPRCLKVELTSIESPAVSVAFTQDVQAADLAAGVSVRVNSRLTKIARAERALYQSDLVHYVLEGPISAEDAITWAYDAARGDLQNANGMRMPSVSERRVAHP